MDPTNSEERRAVALKLISEHTRLRVVELSRLMNVSAVTIRRDLDLLQSEGKVRRQHGWATLQPEAEVERHFRDKSIQAREEKQRIAERAALMVRDGMTITISGGSTTAALIGMLKERKGLTVITNALNIAAEVVHWPGFRLIVAGGQVREMSYGMVGPSAVRTLDSMTADIAFLGVDGLTLEHGMMTPDLLEAEVDAAMVRMARRVVVVADARKIGRSSLAVIGPITQMHTLVTDRGASEHLCRQIRTLGAEVILA